MGSSDNRCANPITSDMLRPIPGVPHYMACSDGRVFSLYTFRFLAPTIDKRTGYCHVSICEGGETWTAAVHRLIALAFVDNPRGLEVVNHKNEVKTDNRASNLEWCTQAENINYGTARARAVETVGIDALRESARRARLVAARNRERAVVNVDTGETFESMKAAAEKHGLRRTGIWGACNGRQRTCGGFHWSYAA